MRVYKAVNQVLAVHFSHYINDLSWLLQEKVDVLQLL